MPPAPALREASRRVLTWWFGLMGLGGFAFGLNAPSRPFGDAVLAHPLIVFGMVAGAALLVLRFAAKKPVPEILPERVLLMGFALGVVMYAGGNYVAAKWIAALA